MTETNFHFEDLWDRCEKLQKDATPNTEVSAIIDDLMMKLSLYKALDLNGENGYPEDEVQRGKSRTMGEILLTITSLSLKDNINVFEALNTALHYRTIQHLDKKNPL